MRTHTLYGIAAIVLAVQAFVSGELVFGFFSALFGVVAFVLYVADAR
jgi:hypothetical protein